MRFFKTEMWGYAVLLIILFVIASLAVGSTLSYIDELLGDSENFHIIATLLISLTLGFMFIAGAFGLWAIKFSSEAEARRRVGRFVDAMDYLSDGIVVVDAHGVVTGSNPSARKIFKSNVVEDPRLKDAFPCLSDEDVELILDSDHPCEMEKTDYLAGKAVSLRFRSQPTEDVVLILISDITAIRQQKLRSRQVARLQLVGEIARGVAHDFNNLLCGISGYVSILPRLQPDSKEMKDAIIHVSRSVERGIVLAGHLLQLSEPPASGRSTDMACEYVANASQLLRDSLPEGWNVEFTKIDKIPTVFVTGSQIEQVVVNLGYLVADSVSAPSTLRIYAGTPGKKGLFDVSKEHVGVIVVSVVPLSVDEIKERKCDVGAIQSVVASLLEEAGGGLDCFYSADGTPVFRVRLFHGNIPTQIASDVEIPDEIKSYISGWNVLAGIPDGGEYDQRMADLEEWNLRLTISNEVSGLLAAIQDSDAMDICIIDARLFGRELHSLLKAVIKLRADTGYVLLCEDPDLMQREFSSDFVVESMAVQPGKLISAMIEARSLALRRQK